MKYDTIIFDMDGVIIDSEVLFDTADTALFEKYGKVYNHSEVKRELAGMHFDSATGILRERYDFPIDTPSLIRERQELLEQQYRTHLQYIVGFEQFFDKVIAAGLKTAVATSSNDHFLSLANGKLELDKKFGKNIFKLSDVNNVSKPNPAIFLYAAEKIMSNPDTCIVIEDAPKGVQAGLNAGMFTIGITTSFTRGHISHANMVIDSYEELDLNQLSLS